MAGSVLPHLSFCPRSGVAWPGTTQAALHPPGQQAEQASPALCLRRSLGQECPPCHPLLQFTGFEVKTLMSSPCTHHSCL